MQSKQILVVLSALLATGINAIDFSGYDPQPGVQEAFKPFLEALVTQAENATATTSFTDYFPADGMMTTLTLHCPGPDRILSCKRYFLPTDGSKSLIHYPNVTSIAVDNSTATVYDSWGRIENTFVNGNCSQIYYKTQYTILKTNEGDVDPNLSLDPQHQVYWYHDYFVNPTNVPSDIPCDSLKSAS